ncbi:hypothetical protein [Pseudoalteromonas luteoviolacea]|uniref:Uncharacterized protein n=1 Tax=Pseudoalteromonas luteoviolacea NCIMB 1942 TaxID=1365253 RepID=A0A167BCS2_9GAMM|nr:hypothetical protein [Pseudoalteromonas luteoviolacea]KZN46384.1 hypothetical protein N482_12840 [Pseudoalteromonas luteoviolacea NCIMB 1942]
MSTFIADDIIKKRLAAWAKSNNGVFTRYYETGTHVDKIVSVDTNNKLSDFIVESLAQKNGLQDWQRANNIYSLRYSAMLSLIKQCYEQKSKNWQPVLNHNQTQDGTALELPVYAVGNILGSMNANVDKIVYLNRCDDKQYNDLINAIQTSEYLLPWWNNKDQSDKTILAQMLKNTWIKEPYDTQSMLELIRAPSISAGTAIIKYMRVINNLVLSVFCRNSFEFYTMVETKDSKPLIELVTRVVKTIIPGTEEVEKLFEPANSSQVADNLSSHLQGWTNSVIEGNFNAREAEGVDFIFNKLNEDSISNHNNTLVSEYIQVKVIESMGLPKLEKKYAITDLRTIDGLIQSLMVAKYTGGFFKGAGLNLYRFIRGTGIPTLIKKAMTNQSCFNYSSALQKANIIGPANIEEHIEYYKTLLNEAGDMLLKAKEQSVSQIQRMQQQEPQTYQSYSIQLEKLLELEHQRSKRIMGMVLSDVSRDNILTKNTQNSILKPLIELADEWNKKLSEN